MNNEDAIDFETMSDEDLGEIMKYLAKKHSKIIEQHNDEDVPF